MNQPLVLDTISQLGRRYLAGELRQHQLSGTIQPSRKEEVAGLDELREDVERLCEIARPVLARGELAFGVLAAGASSRMDLQQLPEQVTRMLRRAGRTQLPTSKALVPVLEIDSEPLNYLDLFLINVQRFSEAVGATGPVVLFVSESNRAEILDHLEHVAWRGIDPARRLIFEQPLEPQIVATPEDARRAASNFAHADMEQVLALSEKYAGHDLPRKKPGGHGEFLHQLVASGTLADLHARGVRWLTARNIDNVAAVFDETWLAGFGYMLGQDAQMLVEVSQRPIGQKGGALVRVDGAWRLAEDPSFQGTSFQATDSYYMNNAAAVLRLDYFEAIYETSVDELQRIASEPPEVSRPRFNEIAARGRAKFPTIVEAKPVNLDGTIVAAVTPETNMWESTGVVPGLRILPFAVQSERDAGEQLAQLEPEEQRARAYRVRFSPTKSWADYSDENKQCISRHVAERIVRGPLV